MNVHHLIGTNLHCALPKCMSIQNYIVTFDLHVHCQPQKYYRFIYRQKVSVFCMFLVDHKKMKNVRGDPHIRWTQVPLVHNTGWWCITPVDGAQRSPAFTRWCTMYVSQTHVSDVLDPCKAGRAGVSIASLSIIQ